MILIVDDSPENIFSLKSILELNRFQTDTASSGEEALKKILKQQYALVLLDVQMPGMDGFEVAEAITSLNKTRDIPIIFLSAVNTHKRFVTRGFESGAVDYITKPIDPDILILKVRNFYRLYEKTHALKQAEKALLGMVNELHSTLEAIPQIAFTTDATGLIEFVNQQWFEYSDSKDRLPQSIPGEPSLEAQWQGLVEKGEPVETEVCIKRLSEDHYHYFLLRMRPVLLNGIITKWVGTFTDIHEQKIQSELLEKKVAERTRELLEINRELELSNHDLQQFASVASHDLKEPLRKIQFFANLLEEKGEWNEQTVKYLNKILYSSERMSNLITDLLSFARLSEAELFQPVDLNEVIHGIMADLELLIAEKNADISIGDLPVIDAVPGLIRQLFQNIISNALKFSKTGEKPMIRIRSELTNEPFQEKTRTVSGAYCRIFISDNGIGFDEKYKEKIFTIFQRLNAREDYEGTGIGLAIARKIVDKHNGMISVHSKLGEGSTFILILPIEQPHTGTVAGEQPISQMLP